MEEPEPLEPPEDPITFAIRDRTPAPPSRGGKLSVFLLILAIGGGIYFFAQSKQITPQAAPEPGPASPGTVTSPFEGTSSSVLPARPAPDRSPLEPSAEPSPPRGVPPAPASAVVASAIPESHGPSMVSSDWAGRAAAYMIHFSSFRKRENAERDAARLAQRVGRPFHVIAVNLGRDGMWFRVMLGDFSSREEAQAHREELAMKGMTDMGSIYRVSAASADRVSAP